MIPITSYQPIKYPFNKPTIMVLNGPIGSGKDAIGAEVKNLVGAYDCLLASFKEELYKYTRDAFGVTLEQIYEWQADRVFKELPRPELGGKSIRQALIHTSETLVKPVYGNQIFGTQLGVNIMHEWPRPKLWVITDSGFNAELIGLCTRVQPTYNVGVVKLYRKGCEYGPNDSRNYLSTITTESLGVPEKDLHNNGTIREAALRVIKLAEILSNDKHITKQK